MSRIGRKPIEIVKGVEVKVGQIEVSVKGPKGALSEPIARGMKVKIEGSNVIVERSNNSKEQRALHGLMRALIANMVKGVSEGFVVNLEIVGVGYKVAKQGKNLNLTVGYSHPIEVVPPEGVVLDIEGANKIKVSGQDKAMVGQVAANIRGIRPPEPYKGKGIKYADEVVRKKAGKVAKVGAAAG